MSEVFFDTAEHREFDEQEPVNLKGLLNLVNLIAVSEAPAEPQGDTPYIYAPGMDKDTTINWLNSITSDLNARDHKIEGIESLKEHHKRLETELGEIEEFLSKTIRA